MSSKPNDVSDADDDELFGKTFLQRLNVAVKLTVPIGAVVASLLTLYIHQEQSSRETNNQREQSESNLRATMFGNLISPLVGKDRQLDSQRYSVLVQLLALNFHEHFQFKPLMKHADDLLEDDLRKLAGTQDEAKIAKINWSRWALRSVAHRVIDSQLALLQKHADLAEQKKSVRTYWIYSKDFPKNQRAGEGASTKVFIPEEQPIVDACVSAPNGKDTFDIVFELPDWRSETVKAHILLYESRSRPTQCDNPNGENSAPGTTQDIRFELNSFSFPFTDNLRLPNGNRVAVFVRDSQIEESNYKSGAHFMKVQMQWFPDDYDLPMELVNRK